MAKTTKKMLPENTPYKIVTLVPSFKKCLYLYHPEDVGGDVIDVTDSVRRLNIFAGGVINRTVIIAIIVGAVVLSVFSGKAVKARRKKRKLEGKD